MKYVLVMSLASILGSAGCFARSITEETAAPSPSVSLIPVALAFPLLYAEEPEGNYAIEYYGDIESGTQLSDLADNEI